MYVRNLKLQTVIAQKINNVITDLGFEALLKKTMI